MKLEKGGVSNKFIKLLFYAYSPPPLQLQTFDGIPCVFFPSTRNVLVIHSFCVSAHVEIGSIAVDTSLNDFYIDIVDIDVTMREKVLIPAQIMNLLLSNKSLSIINNNYSITTLPMIK